MSTPAETTVGFDPLLTGWLAKDNAQKINDASFNASNLLETGFFGPQSFLGQAWDAITGKPNPVELANIKTDAQVNVAAAGGSPADIAQVAKDVQLTIDTAPSAFAGFGNFFSNLVPSANVNVNVDWKSIVIVGLVGLLLWVILKEVL